MFKLQSPRRQLIQLAIAGAIFLGLALWYPHSPMYRDIMLIHNVPSERQQAIYFLVANSFLMPVEEKQVIMKHYKIKPEELEVVSLLEANNDTHTQQLSTGAQIIQDSPILRWLLGYSPPKVEFVIEQPGQR